MDRLAQDRFVRRLNLERYRKLLVETKDAGQRPQLLRLLKEEAAKEQQPPAQE